MAQLEVGDMQLDALTADAGMVFSSWLGLFQWGYLGEVSPLAKYWVMVFRDSFVRRAISRIETFAKVPASDYTQ